MIVCEKCGHKLKDDQTICDICNTPVNVSSCDAKLEAELAESIAKIVECETTDAELYVKEMEYTQGQVTKGKNTISNADKFQEKQSNTKRNSNTKANYKTEVNNKQKTNNNLKTNGNTVNKNNTHGGSHKKKSAQKKNTGVVVAIVITVILAIALIVGLALLTIKRFYSKAQDNFAYYNNTGISLVQNDKYEEAIPYLQKALTYEEAANKINLRFTLYDCYSAMGDTEKAMAMLYNILGIDQYNLEAIVNLERYYENANATDALIDMYEKYKDTEAAQAVAKYYITEPTIAVKGGEFDSDVEVAIQSDYDFDIYYTSDGSEPDVNSKKYSAPIEITEGTTVIKAMAVNQYNIISGVVAEEYTVKYQRPKDATINPKSGNYTTEQIIVISNIPSGGSAYYTLDGSTPDKNSAKYTEPFDMPQGNIVLSVIIYDKNGLASDVVQKNYNLMLADRISQSEAMEFVWKAMEAKSMVNGEHKSSEGEQVKLQYYNKVTSGDITVWAFDIIVATENGDVAANYRMGSDTNTGFVYTVYENNGVFTFDRVLY